MLSWNQVSRVQMEASQVLRSRGLMASERVVPCPLPPQATAHVSSPLELLKPTGAQAEKVN